MSDIPSAFAFDVVDSPAPEPVVPNHRASDEKSTAITPPWRRKREPKEPRTIKPKEPKRSVPYPPGGYADKIEELYLGLAMVVFPVEPEVALYLTTPTVERDKTSGELTKGPTGARKIAEAWDAAAQKSEALRRVIENFTTVTVWGAVISAHIPLFMIVFKNRGPWANREQPKMDPAEAFSQMVNQFTQQTGDKPA